MDGSLLNMWIDPGYLLGAGVAREASDGSIMMSLDSLGRN
jgi:hypothetical protein